MAELNPELHFLCGKIAAGKSTLAKALAERHRAVVLSEDAWLPLLFPDELLTIPDYVRYSARLKKVVGPLVRDLVAAGVSRIVGLVLAPHYSSYSIGQYLDRTRSVADPAGVEVLGVEDR